MGRPSSYTDEVATEICALIRDGLAVEEICALEGMPNPRTVYRWLDDPEREAFRQQYARARELQADNSADHILRVARNVEVGVTAPDAARVIIDAHKWNAGKRNPKKYGEKVAVDHSGEIKTIPDDQLEARLTALMGKMHGHDQSDAGGEA